MSCPAKMQLDDASKLMTIEMGKPLAQTTAQAAKCATAIRFHAGHADR
jgi:succinate-semialdehyde dehydrogenase / glutarate-semialdehyde dehydrogenase